MTWRNMTTRSISATTPLATPLATPLVWAGGGALLMLSTWLVGVVALVRAFARLFG
jgi:hypothetical protein